MLLNMEGKLQKDIMQSALMLGYVSLMPEQLDVVKGTDVFVVLPTGYGKTLCF